MIFPRLQTRQECSLTSINTEPYVLVSELRGKKWKVIQMGNEEDGNEDRWKLSRRKWHDQQYTKSQILKKKSTRTKKSVLQGSKVHSQYVKINCFFLFTSTKTIIN